MNYLKHIFGIIIPTSKIRRTYGTIGLSLNISKVANVSVFISRGSVVLTEGVEVSSSACASTGKITEDVDVETMLSRGQTGNLQ